jgi:MscS family membrane protein
MEALLELLKGIEEHINYLVLGVPLYRIAAALTVFMFFVFLRKLFVLIVVSLIRRLTQRTATRIDDLVLEALKKPFGYLFIALGISLALFIAGLDKGLSLKVLRSFLILVIFWASYNLIVAFEPYIYRFAEKFGREFAKEVGSFLIKLAKAFVLVVGVVAILQEWGINVSTLIASLGIGGLAVALAAKDTAANLFGGLTILADKSLGIGDWVKVGSVEGIVEDIGMRTTKIRTFEKSLITVPNQVFANNPVENFSRRGVRRIKMYIGLTYDTSLNQMRAILRDIKDMLHNHEGIAKDQLIMVYFEKFGDSSLDIFIYCFTNTSNWQKYLEIRQDVNLRIMEIVEKHGSSFAFPSRSLYIEKLPRELEDSR